MSSVSRVMALAMRRRHLIECAHVVQPVREFDQYDANVLRHRQQHLAETLGLLVLARLELDVVELGYAIDHVGDELAEDVSISVLVTLVSSMTSWSSAAASPCASSRHCDRMLATASGCVM